MKKLKKEELKEVKGGASSFTSAMLNALMKTVSTMFSLGQSLGSAIRRSVSGGYCS